MTGTHVPVKICCPGPGVRSAVMKVALTMVEIALAEFAALWLVVRDFYDARALANSILPQAPGPRESPISKGELVFAITPTVEAIQYWNSPDFAES